MNKIIDVPMAGQRSLATVTAEIRTLQDTAKRVVLNASVEIGRRLTEAKSMVAHGEWGTYLRDELGFSQSTANNHMRLFEAYGAQQMSLDGATVKSQALANLTYTQAVELLFLPSEEEREAFVASHDMGKLSTRELREELRKRGDLAPAEDPENAFAQVEAASLREDFMEVHNLTAAAPAEPPAGPDAELLQAKLAEAEAEASEAGERLEKAMEEIKAGKLERARLEEQAKAAASQQAAAEAQAQAAAEKMGALDKQLREARKAEKDARKALQEAKENPAVPEETLAKLRAEAEAAAAKANETVMGEVKAAQEKWRASEEAVSKIRSEAEQAKAKAQEAAKKLEAAEKALRMAAPEMAEFRFRVQAAQEALTACVKAMGALPDESKDGGAKVLRKLLDAFRGQLPEQA